MLLFKFAVLKNEYKTHAMFCSNLHWSRNLLLTGYSGLNWYNFTTGHACDARGPGMGRV